MVGVLPLLFCPFPGSIPVREIACVSYGGVRVNCGCTISAADLILKIKVLIICSGWQRMF
jgi:hypothetical protein